MPAPSAGMAKPWSGPKTSPAPTSGRPLRGSPRLSSCGSTRTPSRPRRRSRRSAKSREKLSLREGDELRVVLVGALELQELVVTAARAVRVLAAHRRARLVHRAAALVLVEQHACRLEHPVLAVA